MTIEQLCEQVLKDNPELLDISVVINLTDNSVSVKGKGISYEMEEGYEVQLGIFDAENQYMSQIASEDSARLFVVLRETTVYIAIRRLHVTTMSLRGERIKELRQKLGYTQEEVALITGINLRMVQAYEQGTKDISCAKATTVVSLAKVLNCSVEYLIGSTLPDIAELYPQQEMKKAVTLIKDHLESVQPNIFYVRGRQATGKATFINSLRENNLSHPVVNGYMCYDKSKQNEEGAFPSYLLIITLNTTKEGMRYIEKIEKIVPHADTKVLFEYKYN